MIRARFIVRFSECGFDQTVSITLYIVCIVKLFERMWGKSLVRPIYPSRNNIPTLFQVRFSRIGTYYMNYLTSHAHILSTVHLNILCMRKMHSIRNSILPIPNVYTQRTEKSKKLRYFLCWHKSAGWSIARALAQTAYIQDHIYIYRRWANETRGRTFADCFTMTMAARARPCTLSLETDNKTNEPN